MRLLSEDKVWIYMSEGQGRELVEGYGFGNHDSEETRGNSGRS